VKIRWWKVVSGIFLSKKIMNPNLHLLRLFVLFQIQRTPLAEDGIGNRLVKFFYCHLKTSASKFVSDGMG